MAGLGAKFVFRGTTVGYKGNATNRRNGCTCTSTQPGKAVLFALECMQRFPEGAVVYIAETKKLAHLETTYNHLAFVENEVIYQIASKEFYQISMGFVPVRLIQAHLYLMGYVIDQYPELNNLSSLCTELEKMENEEIEELVVRLTPFLKNH